MNILKNITSGCSERQSGKAKRRLENRAIRGLTVAQAIAAKKVKGGDGLKISDVVKEAGKVDEESDVE